MHLILGFPLWLRIAHFINLFCMALLMRSGIQILADHPKLYWTDDTDDHNYWIKFGKKKMPKDKLWTSLDEAESVNPVAALPGGHHNLGAARRWHFLTATVWMLSGFVYVALLFATGEWRRLIPTNLNVFAGAWETVQHYAAFQIPSPDQFNPYDPLQQLTYAAVVFLLPLVMMTTALAMSPAFIARFPGYLRLFGGRRQVARSLHFLGFMAFLVFTIGHLVLISIVYFPRNVREITLGSASADFNLAILIFALALLSVLLFNIWATVYTLERQRQFQRLVDAIYEPLFRLIFGRLRSRQRYGKEDISPFFRVNGYPPETTEYKKLQKGEFKDWRLPVTGLVEWEKEFSLAELKALPRREQITKHNCIQGWSAVAEWGGVRVSDVLQECGVSSQARYIVFTAYDEDEEGRPYYETFPLSDMEDEQSILAYEMNWKELPVEHGAPLRLRVETKLGFKMVKYLRSIELVSEVRSVHEGRGGYREDVQHYDTVASI